MCLLFIINYNKITIQVNVLNVQKRKKEKLIKSALKSKVQTDNLTYCIIKNGYITLTAIPFLEQTVKVPLYS